MLSAEQNRLATETGRGTGGGELMRRHWQPAALAEELAGGRPVLPLTLMGEELVLFRDDTGRLGLVGRHCPHRGADLRYGRLEDGGLRCPFHGWLFDIEGQCLHQPAEPPGSNFHAKIRHTAYPCIERNGIIFAYLGPGEPPPLPDHDCFSAPDDFTFAFKGHLECNWLQALEVGIDPSHASFLHRFFEDEEPEAGYGKQFGDQVAGTDIPVTKMLREYDCPRIEIEDTDYGQRIFALRDLPDGKIHVRVTNQLFPNAIVIPMSNDMTITQWHVPIDDTHCWWYAIFSSFAQKVDKKTMREQRLELYTVPDYKPRKNRSNDYGFDPDEQANLTYTGMGMDINVHDGWAVESLGAVQDRTVEHLGTADKAIIASRRRLLKSIEALGVGEAPPAPNGNAASPLAIDTICPAESWEAVWPEHDRDKRQKSPWAATA